MLDVPARFEVTVTLTHGGDHARVQVWLPDTGWNGRFQAAGSSAYAAGDNGAALSAGVKQEYATATTDAGVGDALDTSWALKDGQIDQTLLTNFAGRSQHELALVGKQVVSVVYGKAASYSYRNGCSTGGRQGFMEAQRYPDDFDGIVSGSCDYDPRRLIGTKIVCYGKQVTITAADGAVVRRSGTGRAPEAASVSGTACRSAHPSTTSPRPHQTSPAPFTVFRSSCPPPGPRLS